VVTTLYHVNRTERFPNIVHIGWELEGRELELDGVDLDLENMVCLDHGGTKGDASEMQKQESDGGKWMLQLGVQGWLDND
jgi:hypothetical protein